jgi:hypothetical protein
MTRRRRHGHLHLLNRSEESRFINIFWVVDTKASSIVVVCIWEDYLLTFCFAEK